MTKSDLFDYITTHHHFFIFMDFTRPKTGITPPSFIVSIIEAVSRGDTTVGGVKGCPLESGGKVTREVASGATIFLGEC